ncbi:MAG: TolC family protein [Verrucomicrobia bacterium]|nr:TolC family protein [Verrucomicrobiota bacterium]MBU1909503.1 TolC family protein [Verrucomicrobiota bacterium]
MSAHFFHVRWGLAALFLALRCAGAAPSLTLEESIQAALKNNRPLRLLELNLDSRALGVAEARTEFSVMFQPEGQAATDNEGAQTAYGMSASKKQGIGTAVLAEGRWTKTGFSESPDLHRGVVRVEVRQPLLRRLGRLVNEEPIVQAESSVQAARREVELYRTDLVVQVVEGYEELLRLQRQLHFDTQALQRSEQLLRLTRVRERQGRATRVDALRVDLQHGENQIRLNKTRESLENAGAAFAELLGQTPSAELNVTDSPRLEVEAPGRTEALRVALEHRLDYAQVLADHRDVERGIRIARRNLLPDLELIGRYERSGEGERSSDSFDFDQEAWFVGLAADTDVRRQRERFALGQARLRGESARGMIEIVRSALERQVQQALAAYERARHETLFAQRNYHLAESRARLARRMFEIGKGDNFTVTDAENALLEAQNRMLLSQAEVSIAAYRMLRVLGTLLEYPEDLKPPPGGERES